MASNGSYNYYQLLGPDDKGRVKWCEKIGNYVATEVEKRGEGMDVPRAPLISTSATPTGSRYIMDGLPHGYELYAHCTKSSRGSERRDLYLFGMILAPAVPRRLSFPFRARQLQKAIQISIARTVHASC